jgi:aminoglycoside phosphotransferase (APT) family kinase protein
MSNKLSPNVLHWIEQTVGLGAVVQSARLLDGATSSAVYSLIVSHQQYLLELVLRLFTNKEWLTDEPDLARQEADSLLLAQQLDVPVPELVAVDVDGRFCHYPAILMTRLPGKVQLNPTNLHDWLEKLAATLIKIHVLPADDFPWRYYSWLNPHNFHVPSWAQSPPLWQKAIDIVSQPAPDEPRMVTYCARSVSPSW